MSNLIAHIGFGGHGTGNILFLAFVILIVATVFSMGKDAARND